uniref:Uncharacterized protein n=1 Tax=Anas platyrhynchos platyrhynchos TaxID=8840 RepID=A0A493TZ39_ANAPP
RSPEGARGRPSRSQSQERKRPEAGSRPRGPRSAFTRRSAATQQEITLPRHGGRAGEPCRAVPHEGCSQRPAPPSRPLAGSPHHSCPPWKGDGSRGAAAGPRVEDAGPKPPGEHGAEQAAPPHVLPPARQRGPCQPGAAGVRRQAHLQVHRGGQGHGEESGEEPLAPQNPVPGRAGHSSCPQTAALTSSAPTEPVPSSLGAQLPRDSAPGGCQNDAVENQIGEEGWEDGPGVPVGLEKDPRVSTGHRKPRTRLLGGGKGGAHLVAGGRGMESGAPSPPWQQGQRAPSLPAPQNQSKRREILCNLMLLLGAVRGAQSQESQECWAGQLNRLYRHAEAFLMLLKTWEPPQEEPWEPGCSPGSKERNTAVIFLAYQRLLQGKLRFFFYDLAKDLCNQGQGGGRDPPRGA